MLFLRSKSIPPVLGGVLLCAGAPSAQGIRLANQVERPLVYLAQRAPEASGPDVLSVFQNASLLAALGLDGRRDVKEVDTEGAVLRALQQLLSRLSVTSEANEFAVVGMVPRGGVPLGRGYRPLVVFHSELRQAGAAEMSALLNSDKFTVLERRLHGQKVYRLSPVTAPLGTGPLAADVEFALVDRDLVVSNDRPTMARVLAPQSGATSASSGPGSGPGFGPGFGSKKSYRELRQQLVVPPGSLLLFADLLALAPSLHGLFDGDADWLLRYSGIRRPEQLMLVARPAPKKSGQPAGIATTVLLRHASESYRVERHPDGQQGASRIEKGKDWYSDGWLDLLHKGRLQRLVRAMPASGFAAVTALLDFDRLLRSHPGRRMRSLQARIFRNCHTHRVNLRHQVLRKLSEVGGAQLILVGGGQSPSAARLAYSLQAKSEKKARDVFSVLSKAYSESGEATLTKHGGREELRFRALPHQPYLSPMVIAVVQDRLLFAYDSAVIQRVAEQSSRQRRSTGQRRRNAAIVERLQRLGVGRQHRVSGLFALDLRSLWPNDPTDERKPVARTAGLFGVHGGYFTLHKDLIRLEVFTQL